MSYLREGSLDETNYPLFADVKNAFGFVPNFYRAQTMRPDLIEAQAQLVNAILIKEVALARQDKEYLFLVCSAANLSTYCVTAHCEIIRMLGIRGPEPEQIAADYTIAKIPIRQKALLSFAAKLNARPTTIGRDDVENLRTYGYNDEQILETVLMVGLAKFANFVSFGLGTAPDFDSMRIKSLIEESSAAPSPVL